MMINFLSYHLASFSILIHNWIYEDNLLLFSFIYVPFIDTNTRGGYLSMWFLHFSLVSLTFFNFLSYDLESLFFGYQSCTFTELICAEIIELEIQMSKFNSNLDLEMEKIKKLVAPETYLEIIKQSGSDKFENLLKSIIKSHELYCEYISGINDFMSGTNFVSISMNYIVISFCILEMLTGSTYFKAFIVMSIFSLQITIPCVTGSFISHHVSTLINYLDTIVT